MNTCVISLLYLILYHKTDRENMTNLNQKQYDQAIEEWTNCRGNYSVIQKLISTTQIFQISASQIDQIKKVNNYKEFCAKIGVYSDEIVLILVALDENGKEILSGDYPYSPLAHLKGELALVEKRQYTVINNAVLSSDLRKVDSDSDMYFPVSNKPVMEQDKALDAIERWRDEGQTWFYRECSEFGGSGIFQQFYVPSRNLDPYEAGKVLNHFVCSFGLKFSDVYQKMLVTVIFIAFYDDQLENGNGSIPISSNTYDWSQPCPPICRV